MICLFACSIEGGFILWLYTSRQAQGLDDDLAFDVRAGHVQVLADIEPDWLQLLGCHLNHVLEAQNIATVLQWECFDNISQLHVADLRVLLRKDEHVAIWIVQLVIVLNKIFADDYDFVRLIHL